MFGKKKKKIGLALGGGGTRGIAHLGAIRAFNENGIRFDMVSGSSAGAMAAALYCAGLSFEEMHAAASKLKREDILSSRIFFIPSDPRRVEETVKKVLGRRDDFASCKTPLCILSTDVVSGKEYIFESGSISRAVSASCAVPLFFAPVIEGDQILMDGGLLSNIPAGMLRDRGCDIVISVSVGDLSTPIAKSSGMIEVAYASIKIMLRNSSVNGKQLSDIVIEPELGKHKHHKLEKIDELIEAGYRATMAQIPKINELLNKGKRGTFVQNTKD